MKKNTIIFFIFLLSVSVYATDNSQLLKQVDRNLNPESFESYRKLINIEPNGREKEFVLFTVKKGKSKIAALFISPASEEGRSTLRLDENVIYCDYTTGKYNLVLFVTGNYYDQIDRFISEKVNNLDGVIKVKEYPIISMFEM